MIKLVLERNIKIRKVGPRVSETSRSISGQWWASGFKPLSPSSLPHCPGHSLQGNCGPDLYAEFWSLTSQCPSRPSPWMSAARQPNPNAICTAAPSCFSHRIWAQPEHWRPSPFIHHQELSPSTSAASLPLLPGHSWSQASPQSGNSSPAPTPTFLV
jgi:hypothetical protein